MRAANFHRRRRRSRVRFTVPPIETGPWKVTVLDDGVEVALGRVWAFDMNKNDNAWLERHLRLAGFYLGAASRTWRVAVEAYDAKGHKGCHRYSVVRTQGTLKSENPYGSDPAHDGCVAGAEYHQAGWYKIVASNDAEAFVEVTGNGPWTEAVYCDDAAFSWPDGTVTWTISRTAKPNPVPTLRQAFSYAGGP